MTHNLRSISLWFGLRRVCRTYFADLLLLMKSSPSPKMLIEQCGRLMTVSIESAHYTTSEIIEKQPTKELQQRRQEIPKNHQHQNQVKMKWSEDAPHVWKRVYSRHLHGLRALSIYCELPSSGWWSASCVVLCSCLIIAPLYGVKIYSKYAFLRWGGGGDKTQCVRHDSIAMMCVVIKCVTKSNILKGIWL